MGADFDASCAAENVVVCGDGRKVGGGEAVEFELGIGSADPAGFAFEFERESWFAIFSADDLAEFVGGDEGVAGGLDFNA